MKIRHILVSSASQPINQAQSLPRVRTNQVAVWQILGVFLLYYSFFFCEEGVESLPHCHQMGLVDWRSGGCIRVSRGWSFTDFFWRGSKVETDFTEPPCQLAAL
jgi:hypothetical protein